MSLQALRAARMERQKPGVVMVVIGDLPRWFDYDAGTIVIRPDADLARTDWRPLVGLQVALFTIGQQPGRTLAVLDRLQAAGALLVGFADASGIVADQEEMQAPLQRAREVLCRC